MGRGDKSKKYGSRDVEGSTSGSRNGKGGSTPPPSPSKSGNYSKGVEYTRRSPPLPSAPPLVLKSHSSAPRTTRSYPNRNSKNSDETSISLDTDAPPLGNLEDKLDDVLPFVPMSSGMEQLLDEVMENMDQDEPATKSAPPAKSSSVAKHTPPAMSDPATNSSTVAGSDLVVKPASLVTKPASLTTSTGTPEVDKKRSSGAINDKDVGITAKKPRTSACDVSSKSNNLEGFYSPEAKELRVLIEQHQNILAGENTLLEKLKVPPTSNISTPSLVLPPGIAAKYISIGLKDIQEALREQPINKELTITKIESVISMWKISYANEVPPDLEILIRHLEAVVARLGGKGGLATSHTSEPAPAQVSSLLEKLDAAHAGITQGLCRLEKEGPRLEGRLANLASICNRQKKLAEEHRMLSGKHQQLAKEYKALCEKETEMAALAEKRTCVLADMMTSSSCHLEAHEDAVRSSSQVAESYTRRRAEAVAFLAGGGTLPEIATILAYKAPE
ncbi:hypothetical protein VPH35_110527 [Triticum aestivum]